MKYILHFWEIKFLCLQNKVGYNALPLGCPGVASSLHRLTTPNSSRHQADPSLPPSSAPQRYSGKSYLGDAQSPESENLTRFSCLPNTILHAVCQANHWALLISHFTENILGPQAVAAIQEGGIENAFGKSAKAVWSRCVVEDRASAISETSQFTEHIRVHYFVWVQTSLWEETARGILPISIFHFFF